MIDTTTTVIHSLGAGMIVGFLTGSLLGFVAGGVGYYSLMKAGDIVNG